MSVVLATAMIMSASTATTFTNKDIVITANAATEGTFKSFKYIAYDTYIAITGFEGIIEEVEIPSEIEGLPVTLIDEKAFYEATNLKKVTIPEGVEGIGDSAFYGCSSLTDVNLPDSLLGIGYFSFQRCISLEEIILPQSLLSIGTGAFSGCAELKRITFPSKLSNISDNVCTDCKSLEEVVIKNGPTKIWHRAFSNCTSLTKVYLPRSISALGGLFGGYDNSDTEKDSFYNCPSLTHVYYAGTANQWSIIDEYSKAEFANATIHFEAEEILAPEESPKRLTPDVNCDGSIDASDASVILAYYAYIQTGGTGTIGEFVKL